MGVTVLKDNEGKKISKNTSFRQSLNIAIFGIKTAIAEERNMRFHVFALIAVLIAGFIFQLSLNDWLWISLAIVLVIVCEMINSMLERVVDLIVGKQYNDQAKIIKDMAAGTVLISTVFAIIVGVLIFGPELLNLF